MNQIVGDFTKFYIDLFGKTTPRVQVDWRVFGDGKCLSFEDQASLVFKVTKEEIKGALFGIGNEKAPGPDGIPAGFFKKNWDNAINEFFDKGFILKELNYTAVTLIPKKSHERTVAKFRPIACTNVVYKVITKILTNRMENYKSSTIRLRQREEYERQLSSSTSLSQTI